MNEQQRFWAKVEKTAGGCWNWTATKRGGGYGAFYLDGKYRPAHRVSWSWENGSVPDGLVIHHVCRNTACVRPSHLRAVTQKENLLQGPTIITAALSKTECHKGHPLSGENLRITKEGWRVCRTCETARFRRNEARAHTVPMPCPICGKELKYVGHHMRYMHPKSLVREGSHD